MQDFDIKKVLDKIRNTRKEKGISQAEVGNMLGISQKGYADIENGKNALKVEAFFKILKFLEIDILQNGSTSADETSLITLNPDFLVQYIKDDLTEKKNIKEEIESIKKGQEEIKSLLTKLLDQKNSQDQQNQDEED
ncbi:MAG: helix-turn-helix transcriptional regulator [Bacteroidia bacterium]|nr:helix-turn-helix transcriptional regulator [Bacteroidia bacterium]